MLKILPIKKSEDFQKIGKKGQKFYSHTVLLLTHPTPQNYLHDPATGKMAKEFCRIGFTVAKTVSKLAVERNLAKRRLREIFKKLVPLYAKANHDYVVIARKEITAADFKKISTDLKFCISKIHQNKIGKDHDRAKKTQ